MLMLSYLTYIMIDIIFVPDKLIFISISPNKHNNLKYPVH